MLREALRSTANRRDNVSPVLYQPAKTKSDLIPGPRTQESKDWLLSGINSAMSEGGHILDVGCANGYVQNSMHLYIDSLINSYIKVPSIIF